jgi:hypothetical protein
MARFPIVVALALALVAPAAAGNVPNSQLDAAASAVAGKPVTVWCESHWSEWIHTGDSVEKDWSSLGGFTILSEPIVYLSPDICETLHALLRYGDDVGSYHASVAIHVLVHEAVHQTGIENEGETDCKALALDRQVALDHFGYSETEPQQYIAKTVKRVKGKRVTTYAVRTRQVPSRRLADFSSWTLAWHKAAPAEYQGAC